MTVSTTQLTPLSFLQRSARVYPRKTAVVHGDGRWSYRQLADEVEVRAAALTAAGVRPGDRVAYLMPNVPELLMAHFAVPLTGAVLVAINTRLAPEEVRYILDHSGATALVVDSALVDVVRPIASTLKSVQVIAVAVDPEGSAPSSDLPGAVDLADLVEASRGLGNVASWSVEDENAPISINYTSGTTGRPKGVVYTHRGAYLNALGEIHHSEHDADSVYLWTLPMFHCNGWCTAWAVVAAGGTQVCLREVRGDQVWSMIDRHAVTHLNGAPTVVTTILSSSSAHELVDRVTITVAGAPPSPTTLAEAGSMGFSIVHVYGLTETYGPYAVCAWQDEWSELSVEERADRQSRQGVGMIQAERLRVVERDLRDGRLVDVPADGATMGEVVMRGNNVMWGYHCDPEATERAFVGGWFHSGDLGVMHPDGYVQLLDRAKDVIISGGENISTIEVEQALASHPDVLEVAVIGVPDERWGERPKAFVIARGGRSPEPADLLAHVTGLIARYKAPRDIEIVTALPKTSTGKIQKFELRDREWSPDQPRIRG